MAALAADEEAAEVAVADGAAGDDDDEVATVVVATCVEVAAAVVESAELVLLDSGVLTWVAARSPIGSCCDARTGSSIAEATRASNNEYVAFFILSRLSH